MPRNPLQEGYWRDKRNALYHLPLGDVTYRYPRPGESVEQLEKRLKRLTRHYRSDVRAYRVERQSERVMVWRVPPGRHTKLAMWYQLEPGQSVVLMRGAGQSELRAAKQSAGYLHRKGSGAFSASLSDDGALTIHRHT